MNFSNKLSNNINKDIKKEYTYVKNRLQSIILDNQFIVDQIIPCFPDFPIIPNERCGLWYCKPDTYQQTSYFKSTDGHTNEWDFSTRRLNFHLFDTIVKNGGIVIIDSTRRGKKIPDALSKTIPLWCAVLNSLMIESDPTLNSDGILYVPPSTVSKSEYNCMLNKIPLLVQKLKKLDIITGEKLIEKFNGKLLRPIWVEPGSSILESNYDPFTGEKVQSSWEIPDDENIIPLILCTVSYVTQDGVDKRYGFTYVQGAADDHELWSHGLEPDVFWEHIDFLGDINNSEDMLVDYIEDLILEKKNNEILLKKLDVFKNIDTITNELSLGIIVDNLTIDLETLNSFSEFYSMVIILSENVKLDEVIDKENKENAKYLNNCKIYPLSSGSKRSSKELRNYLQIIYDAILEKLHPSTPKNPILIVCNNGKDMSIAVLLAILCKQYDLDWKQQLQASTEKITVKKHLVKIVAHLQGRNINPSRATLNSVNSFLIPRK